MGQTLRWGVVLCGCLIAGTPVGLALSAEPPESFASFESASLFQPPPTTPMTPPAAADDDDDTASPLPTTNPPRPPIRRGATSSTWRSASLSRRPVTRLASIPKMFGDFDPMNGYMAIYNQLYNGMFATDIASAGVGQRLKVLENNNAWPDNRIDFVYRHYHNALSSTPPFGAPNVNQFPVDSYTFSWERTFLDGDVSLQVVMPFLGTPTIYSADMAFPNNHVSGGNVGNAGVVFKGLLYEDGAFAFSGGLGVNAPTGSNANGRAFDTAFEIQNRAWQLAPYASFIWAPGDGLFQDFFMQGGIQYDMVAGSNRVMAHNATAGFSGPLMDVVDPNLLFVDLTCGVWLWENPEAPILSGVAGQVELHSATSGASHFAAGAAGSDVFVFGGPGARIDNLNITGGLRFMLFGNMTLGVSGVAPLNGRLFDAEVQAITSIFL
ncbi:MAG: hypothetical protein RIC55_14060 [Pirellulaceae bacterium]